MKKKQGSIHSQRGSAMLAALMVFLILSVLGAAIISVAGMEAKMAVNDTRAEQARQAADAGIHVGRDMILNYMLAGESLPSGCPDVIVGNNAITTLAFSSIDSNGVVTITSKGQVLSDSGQVLGTKTVEAEICTNYLPSNPIHTNSFSASGKYVANVSEIPLLNDLFGLLNLQDWDVQATKPDGWGIRYPYLGPEYGDLEDPKHPHFTASNTNNKMNNRTWWVDYKYYKSGLVNLSASSLHISPYWKPQGIVNVVKADGSDAPIIVNQWDSDQSDLPFLFDSRLTRPIQFTLANLINLHNAPSPEYAPQDFDPRDFWGKGTMVNDKPVPNFGEKELAYYQDIASTDENWQYIACDSPLLREEGNTPAGGKQYRLLVDDPGIVKTQWYIDLGSNDRVNIDFTTADSWTGTNWTNFPGLDSFINSILNNTGTFFNRFKNELNSIIVVSPASLETHYDSYIFEAVNDSGELPHIFMLSGQDVSLFIQPSVFETASRIFVNQDSDREVRTYLLAGHNLNIESVPQKVTFKGVISAGEAINIRMKYFNVEDGWNYNLREKEKYVTVIEDKEIINDFPEPWAYLGVAPIVSYRYIN